MKKIRKNTQLTLTNPKRAGRPAIHDKGVRHRERLKFKTPSSFHLTIKVKENKADIKNKFLLKALYHAIRRGRLKGLKVIHYTLEYNHIHFLIESGHHDELHKGMQALGISFSKAVNKYKRKKGTVYKHRYHQRRLSSPTELKRVLHYIFQNGIKHRRTRNKVDPYNSLMAETRLDLIYKDAFLIWADIKTSEFLRNFQSELYRLLDKGDVYYRGLRFT